MGSLIAFDHWLFSKINLDWTNGFFDWLFPAITDLHKDPRVLIVILPLIAFWVWKQRVYALKCLLALVLSIGFADLCSYRVIKANAQRDRPFAAGLEVHLRTHQHSGTSFPSNHAANIFAAATSMTFALPAAWPLYFLVAFAVAYSRVYVGVHFPLDVTAGALLGATMAILVWFVLRKWIKKSASKAES